ncbi:cyclase family protein [Jiangella asiatica]|nr:cyclase family protein [Jiangella asiatica]
MTATSSVHTLTLPIAPHSPVSSVFPWDSPHLREDIATVERNRAHLFHIRMGSGTGTRMRTSGYGDASGATIDSLPRDRLVNLDTVVLRIPKDREESIGPADVRTAFEASDTAGAWTGCAVLLVTGWGDHSPRELGEDYLLATPHLSAAGAADLAGELRRRGAPLFLTDCADVDRPGGRHARAEWASVVPWQRPPWPSDQAKAYLRHYPAEKARADRAVSLSLTAVVPTVVALAGCGSIQADRVRLTALPLAVTDVAEAPCTVVAEPL